MPEQQSGPQQDPEELLKLLDAAMARQRENRCRHPGAPVANPWPRLIAILFALAAVLALLLVFQHILSDMVKNRGSTPGIELSPTPR